MSISPTQLGHLSFNLGITSTGGQGHEVSPEKTETDGLSYALEPGQGSFPNDQVLAPLSGG